MPAVAGIAPAVSLNENTTIGTVELKDGVTGLKATVLADRLWADIDKVAVVAGDATITRPADTTAYADKDLVANSTSAGSVVAPSFTAARTVAGGGYVVGARIQKSTNVVTNAAFRLHLFSVVPTFTSAGDNSALATVVVALAKGYLGYVDVTAMVGFSDVAWGVGAIDNSRGKLPFIAVAQTLYGVLEAKAAYTPGDSEVFTLALLVAQK